MTLEELLTPYPAPVVALVQRLRRLVKAALPDAEERVYPALRDLLAQAVALRAGAPPRP